MDGPPGSGKGGRLDATRPRGTSGRPAPGPVFSEISASLRDSDWRSVISSTCTAPLSPR